MLEARTSVVGEAKSVDPLGIKRFVSQPKVTQNEIVFLGCSYTKGATLDNPQQAYASLMSTDLNLVCKNYAQLGLNNYEMFDILSQLNFDNDASVVLQLTELSRLRVYNESKKKFESQFLKFTNDASYLKVYNDEQLIYETLRLLDFWVKYARAKNLKFIIWSIARFGNEQYDTMFETYLNSYPEYIFMDNSLNVEGSYRVDNGNDGTEELGTGHPGPKSHVLIAEKLLKHYNILYDIQSH